MEEYEIGEKYFESGSPARSVLVDFYARIDKNIFLNVSGTAFVVNVTNVETVAGVKKVHGNFSGTLKSVAGEVLQFTEGKF